jgi:hypothetical protein
MDIGGQITPPPHNRLGGMARMDINACDYHEQLETKSTYGVMARR